MRASGSRARATRAAARLEVIPLPMPAPVVFDGQRLPASYANFYIGNARGAGADVRRPGRSPGARHPRRAVSRPRGGRHPRARFRARARHAPLRTQQEPRRKALSLRPATTCERQSAPHERRMTRGRRIPSLALLERRRARSRARAADARGRSASARQELVPPKAHVRDADAKDARRARRQPLRHSRPGLRALRPWNRAPSMGQMIVPRASRSRRAASST